ESIQQSLAKALGGVGEELDKLGNGQDGACENDRHYAAHGHLNGQEGALAAIHLAAHNLLGVLHGDAALGLVHKDDDPNDHQEQHHEQRGQNQILAGGGGALHTQLHVLPHGAEGDRQPGDDTGKQDDGNAVAHTLVVNLLAHPHDKGGAGGKSQHDDEGNEHTGKAVGVFHNALAAQVEVVGHALDEAQDNGDIPGDGGNLLAAFFPFLGHPLQQRDGDGQQLHDDGAVDIGG